MQPYIEITADNVKWKNWHRTLRTGGKVVKWLKPYNRYINGPLIADKPFIAGMAGLQTIINSAANDNVKVRAYGSRWSLNNIAFTKDYIVNSNALDYSLIGLAQNHVTAPYQDISDRLAFVQCGVMVKTLNQRLQRKNLALPTSGASDGQTFIGAVSTGTHGSAHQVGAMENYVRGIHLVTLDNQLIFLQRKSDPVVSSEFTHWLTNTKLVEDDELFNAALVSFGSFGFIHGLIIQTTPLYLLEKFVKRMTFSPAVENAICTMNVAGLGLPKGDELPFHFEVVLNPYYLDAGEEGVFVRVLYKVKSTEQSITSADDETSGNDVFDVATHLTSDNLQQSALAMALQVALNIELKPTTGELIPKYPAQQFSSSESDAPTSPAPLPGTSIEISVPLSRVGDAMKIILAQTKAHPFGAPLAFRYVKNSKATLAFTQYGPLTVAMEMPGLDDALGFAKRGHQAIFEALANSDIPHAYHWGQALPQNRDWIANSYSPAKLTAWKQSRLKLLGDEGCNMFTNTLLEKIGLNQ